LARAWLHAGPAAVVVSVAQTRGSVPRESGTRMLVSADQVAGTVGGGHLELKAIAMARDRLAQGRHDTWDWPVALGPTLGQCCGGTLTLNFAPLDAAALAAWPDERVLFDLQLHGAGHVGRAIIKLLSQIPCRVQWVDEREAEFRAALLPNHIEKIGTEPVQAEVALALPGTYFLVLTHSHDLDLALAEAILKRGDFGWFGLIGSATKRARFRRRLADKGFDEALLDRMTCPIGLPDIASKVPGVIAVSVVAQMLQHQKVQSRIV
jgi:xanthine dehydrogenase accessory factor